MNEIETKLRELSLQLLSSGNAISPESFELMRSLLLDTNNEDIVDNIERTDGGYYFLTPQLTHQLRMAK